MKKIRLIVISMMVIVFLCVGLTGCGGVKSEDVVGLWQYADDVDSTQYADLAANNTYAFCEFFADGSWQSGMFSHDRMVLIREGNWQICDGDVVLNSAAGSITGFNLEAIEDVPAMVEDGQMVYTVDGEMNTVLTKITKEKFTELTGLDAYTGEIVQILDKSTDEDGQSSDSETEEEDK